MKIVAYPNDDYGCGHYRVIWPAEAVRSLGLDDITTIRAQDRKIKMTFRGDELLDVDMEDDIDVVVLQRPTDWRLIQLTQWMVDHGIAVVVDVDDDLAAIHPQNPAFRFLDPKRAEHEVDQYVKGGFMNPAHREQQVAFLKQQYTHSWTSLAETCKIATLVTVSTPGLLRRYAQHGRGVVVPNYLPDSFFKIPHQDSDELGWPAAIFSHPNDPQVVGSAITRLVSEGAPFRLVGNPEGSGRAFGLREDPPGGEVPIIAWPFAVAQIGIGIAPLADTLFNSRKSWLKPMEMSAVGVPWVASPRAEYKKIHAMGAGILAEKPKDWYRELKRLRSDAGLRAELSEAGRDVASQLRLREHAGEWRDAWAMALELIHNGASNVVKRAP